MTATSIIEAAHDSLPMKIHTSNGKVHLVNHIDYITASPVGDFLVVFREDGGLNLINPGQVTELVQASQTDGGQNP